MTNSLSEQLVMGSRSHHTTLEISAWVTITDQTGTTITTPSLAEVTSLINQRPHHAPPPIIALHPSHQDDPFFVNETWQLVQDGFLLTSFEAPQVPDYWLAYHDWYLNDDNGNAAPTSHNHPEAIGQMLANTAGATIYLTSDLPGIPTYQFDPTQSTAQAHDRREEGTDMATEISKSEPEPTEAETLVDPAPLEFTSQDADQSPPPQSRREARASFLTKTQHASPARQGWRGAFNAIGLRMRPSPKEQAERNDIHAVSQHWPGPRTIAVVNGKGGAGKTPTTILLAAVLARYGGGGVLAWDNNQFRGTLGWRTEQAGHENTILELLPQAEELLATGAQSADLAHFVHHQTTDRFDVLRSKPKVLADKQRFNQNDVDAVHQVTSKFYRIIIIDSGNDESDALWQRMIDHTHQLVVATTTSDETAEGGALLLEDLANTGDHGTRLADNAVVIVSQSVADATKSAVDQKVKGFEPLAREVVPIPYDPAMVDGALTFSALHPTTQRAWLAAAASVARGL